MMMMMSYATYTHRVLTGTFVFQFKHLCNQLQQFKDAA